MPSPVLPVPIFVVNFKSYVWGREALKIARKMEEIAQESSVYLCAIPQIVDISIIARYYLIYLLSIVCIHKKNSLLE